MSKNRVAFVVLSLFLVLSFMSCDGKTPTTIEGLTVSNYKQVTLTDLEPFGSEYVSGISIPPFSSENVVMEGASFHNGLWALEQTLDSIIHSDDLIMSPLQSRSIAAGFQLFIRNEGLRLHDFADEKPIGDFGGYGSTPYSDCDIEYFDIILAGKINSLSNLLSLLQGDRTMMTSAISGDGRIQISEKIRASRKESDESDELVVIESLFADLQITTSIPSPLDGEGTLPTAKLNGELQFSVGTNMLEIQDPDNSASSISLSIPAILSCKLAPFKDVDVSALQEGEDDGEPWAQMREALWPDASEDDVLLTVTRVIGPLQVNAEPMIDTLTNGEALVWLRSFIPEFMSNMRK